jgi:hypothetical protein
VVVLVVALEGEGVGGVEPGAVGPRDRVEDRRLSRRIEEILDVFAEDEVVAVDVAVVVVVARGCPLGEKLLEK